jgi:hypothetical protein
MPKLATNAGSKRICQPGINWYQTIRVARMAKLMRKSTNATITAAIGNQPWKVHLTNKIGIREEAVRCLAHGGSKKAPTGKDHKRIRRRAIRWQVSQFAEKDGEDYHGQKWPDERPRRPDHRLLVAHSDVAPSQDSKKFPVTPQVMPIVPFGSSRFDDQHVITTKGNPAEILLLLAH